MSGINRTWKIVAKETRNQPSAEAGNERGAPVQVLVLENVSSGVKRRIDAPEMGQDYRIGALGRLYDDGSFELL